MSANGGGFHNDSGASWADQWDYAQEQAPAKSKSTPSNPGGVAKTKKAAAAAGQKAKGAALLGFRKAKEGAVTGFYWAKDKYNSTTKKNGGGNQK